MNSLETKIEEVCGPMMDGYQKAIVTALVAPVNRQPTDGRSPEMLRADVIFKAISAFVSTSHNDIGPWSKECIHVAHEFWRSGLYSAEVFAYVIDAILCD